MENEQEMVDLIEKAADQIGGNQLPPVKENEVVKTDEKPEVTEDKGEKKEEKPEVQNQDEDDKDLPSLEEGENPQAENFRKLREITKTERLQRKELEKKLKDFEAQAALQKTIPFLKNDVPLEQRVIQAPDNKPLPALRNVVAVMSKAIKGEYDSDSDDVLRDAKADLSKYSPDELVSIIEDARRGAFGDVSGEIAEACKSELPLASLVYQRRQQQEITMRKQYELAKKNMDETLVEFPELKDEKSPLKQSFNQVAKEIIGEVDKDGKIVNPGIAPHLVNSPDIFKYMTQLAHYRILKGEFSQVKSEAEKLKAKNQYITSPETNSRSANSSGKPNDLKSLQEDIRNEFKKLGL